MRRNLPRFIHLRFPRPPRRTLVPAPCYDSVVGARVTLALGLVLAGACRSAETAAARSPLERSIEETLGARFKTPVVARCFDFFAPACEVMLPDGSSLPISVIRRGTEVEWSAIGLVVTSDELEAYLRAEVGELGAPQDVRCAPRIRRINAGDRIECWLARGGKGFVTVGADGSTSVEVVLDAASANARSELVTPARETELLRASKVLDSADETGEDERPTLDAGAPEVEGPGLTHGPKIDSAP